MFSAGYGPGGRLRMSDDHAAFRARLHEEARSLTDTAARSASERAPVQLDQQSVGRLSRMDALQVQAMAKAEQVRRDTRLQRVKAALTRLDDGDYGDCLRCGEGIDNKRLDADPAATLCIACARGD